ncbi:hypothetical protein BHE74_00036940 [Ensete ventricosum]|nr:hypothetical protein BHE74_00036940 [Ensete ventricosum]
MGPAGDRERWDQLIERAIFILYSSSIYLGIHAIRRCHGGLTCGCKHASDTIPTIKALTVLDLVTRATCPRSIMTKRFRPTPHLSTSLTPDQCRAPGGSPHLPLVIFWLPSLAQEEGTKLTIGPPLPLPLPLPPSASAAFFLIALTTKGTLGIERERERDGFRRKRDGIPSDTALSFPCFPGFHNLLLFVYSSSPAPLRRSLDCSVVLLSPFLFAQCSIARFDMRVYAERELLDSYTGQKEAEKCHFDSWTPEMSLAIGEKKPQQQRRPGGFVAIFFQLLDWNRRLAKKKFFSRKPLPSAPGLVARLMGLQAMPVVAYERPRKATDSGRLSNEQGSGRESLRMDQDLCLEDGGIGKLETRPHKLQKTGAFLERKRTDHGRAKPGASGKKVLSSPSKEKLRKLVSPVKSPRLPSVDHRTRLMKAATKILEPGLQSRSRAKSALTYMDSFPGDAKGADFVTILKESKEPICDPLLPDSSMSYGSLGGTSRSEPGEEESLRPKIGSSSSKMSHASCSHAGFVEDRLIPFDMEGEHSRTQKTSAPVQAKITVQGKVKGLGERYNQNSSKTKPDGSPTVFPRNQFTQNQSTRVKNKAAIGSSISSRKQGERDAYGLNGTKGSVFIDRNVGNCSRLKTAYEKSSHRRALGSNSLEKNMPRKRTIITMLFLVSGGKLQFGLAENCNATRSSDLDTELLDSATSVDIRRSIIHKIRHLTYTSLSDPDIHCDDIGFSKTKLGEARHAILNAVLLFENFTLYRSDNSVDTSLESFLLDMLQAILDALRVELIGEPSYTGTKGTDQLRELIFDCMIECLNSRYYYLCNSGYTPCCNLPFLTTQEQLMREVAKEIRGWIDLAGKYLDDLVKNETETSFGKWTYCKIEAFEASTEMESNILENLVDELVIDFWRC